MSDSPKCVSCLTAGKVGQTYRLAGSGSFKCSDCGSVYPRNSFDPIELEWRTNNEEWKAFMKDRGVNFVS